AAVGMVEATLAEEAVAVRPDERRQGAIGIIVNRGIGADVEIARAVVLERRERGVLAEDVGNALPGKSLAEAQAFGHAGDDPPILPCLTGHGQERPLARDA